MYQHWADRMGEADGAAGRKAVVADMRKMFAISAAKAYRLLAENGWDSGRAKRKDAGASSVDRELLAAVGEMVRQCVRKNGKATLPVNVARSILEARGIDVPVGDSRLRELLRQNHLSVADGRAASPHQAMRTEHPNQVHFADPSVCLIYFAPGGRQKLIGDDELYKNKNFLEGRDKCWRYVLTDHYSGCICARYYAARGETAANMWDFLLYAWGRKENNANVFHGIPELLVWDCGSANVAKATGNTLRAFGVKTAPHMPGNPRAKGQVESANNLVETQFESRLRFEPVNSIEELNNAVERWYAAYNANLLAGLDTRLRRGGVCAGSRASLWQKIPKEHLRELPDSETCRQVFAAGIQTRKVAGDLTVAIAHPRAKRSLRYSVRDLPSVMVGMEIMLQPLLTTDEPLCIAIIKNGKEETSYEIAPVVFDNAGFDVSAPVFGAEYSRPKDTAREKARKSKDNPSLAALMGPAHSFIKADNPFVKQAEGTAIEVAETVHTHEIIISAVEAAKRVMAALGSAPDGYIDDMRANYPDGVPSRIVDAYISERKPKADPPANARDRIVEGGAKNSAAAKVARIAAAEKTSKIA